ncbi:unnamed protein product [Leptidea sinapis]|uniref:Uncharacterized protein n=1 Tax=Leptidea sinapis TaxID=189913 RepID=A0A5E4QN87_9NEOP|nr:unnamed protein product [Leptidea sinapis]
MTELLAFLNNKVDVLPETAILETCMTAYTINENEEACSVALKLLAPHNKFFKKKKRRGIEKHAEND